MNGKLNIDLVVVGSMKEKAMRQLVDEYAKRISKYAKLNIKELKDESNAQSEQQVLEKERDKLLKAIDPNSYLIIMDIKQKQLTSEAFAAKLNDIGIYENSKITFVIGGSLGIHPEIKQKANYRLSFSEMTFPHQLFRVMLLEQIYRAFRINNNAPYHK